MRIRCVQSNQKISDDENFNNHTHHQNQNQNRYHNHNHNHITVITARIIFIKVIDSSVQWNVYRHTRPACGLGQHFQDLEHSFHFCWFLSAGFVLSSTPFLLISLSHTHLPLLDEICRATYQPLRVV